MSPSAAFLVRVLAGGCRPGSNDLEIRAVAIARSGHHAVINWILHQIEGHRVFLNSCVPGKNPFASCHKKHSIVFSDEALITKGPALRLFWSLQAAGRFSRKSCLAYNYENLPFEAIRSEAFERNREKWLGISRHSVDLLVLRDPFNLFASKIRWQRLYVDEPRKPAKIAKDVALWKAHAREFLESQTRDSPTLAVSFNRWFESAEYRLEIANRLRISYSDRGLRSVGVWGHGSSFDARAFDGNAQRMRVLDRWRAYVSDEPFKQIFQDSELVELSEAIFGRMPGAEILCR